MRFAFRTHLHHTSWDEVFAFWRAADELEVFSVGWVADHFYPTRGDPTGPCLESWTTLAALGQATQRLRLGVLVSANAYRHPALVANMACTLDHVTGGRLELGLGTGWSQSECDDYGIALGSLRERFDAFDEACEVLTRLLTQPSSDFSGAYYRLSNARCEPKPLQQPAPPITIGGAGERRALRSVARYAQHWNFRGGDLSELPHKREVLAGHCAQAGRDVGEIGLSMQLDVVDDDLGRLRDTAEEYVAAGVDLAVLTLPQPHRVELLARAASRLEDLATA